MTERKQMDHTLRESETHFREFFENALIGMYRAAPDGRILLANSALVGMLGSSSFEELAQQNLAAGYEPDHPRSSFRQRLERDGRVIGLESAWVRNDGRPLFVRESARIVRDEAGRVLCYEGTVEDITDRKRIDEALRDREQCFETLANATSEAIFIAENGVCVDANQAAAEMFGYAISELIGMFGTDVIAPESRLLVKRNMLGGHEESYEAVALRKDGSTFPCEIKGRMLHRGDRQICITALRDVTRRKQAEETLQKAHKSLEQRVKERTAEITNANRLLRWEIEEHRLTEQAFRRSEARLRNAQRVARLGFWEHDIVSDDLYWSEEIYRIFGVSKESFAGTYDAFLSAVHPEDRESVRRQVDAAVNQRAPYSIDHRIVLPSGEVRHVHEQGEAVHDSDGVAIRMMGTVLDITERKLMEDEIRAREERFRTLAESAHDLISLVDSCGKTVWANGAWRRRFGDDIKGWEDTLQRVHPHDRDKVAGAWSDLVSYGREIEQLEYRFLGPSDEYLIFDTTARPAECGSLLFFWVASDDITERKAASSNLRAEKERAQLFLDVAGVMLLALDCDGKVAMVNRRGCEILGREEPNILGKDWFTHFLPADSCDEVRRIFAQIIAGDVEPVEYVEYLVLCAGGATRMIAWHNVILRDVAGEIVGTLSSGEDITERQRTEKEQATTLSLRELVIEDSSRRKLIADVTGLLKQHFELEAVGIWLRDGDDFPYFETRGCPPEFVRVENRICQMHQAGEIVRDGQGNPVLDHMYGNVIRGHFDPALPFFTEKGSFWTCDTSEFVASDVEHNRLNRFLSRDNESSYGSVGLIPLVVAGETFGLLQLQDTRKNRLTPKTITLCERLADILATGLAHRTVTKQLRQSQESLARAQKVAKTGSWEWDLSKGKIRWSEEMYRIHGVSTDTEPTLDFSLSLVHSEDRWILEEALATMPNGGKGAADFIEYRIVRPDGEKRCVCAKADLICDEAGNPTQLFGTVQDITEHRAVENALRASEASLSAAEVIGGVGSWDWDLTVDRLRWSHGLCRIFGIRPGEFGEKYTSFLEFLPADEIQQAREDFDQAINGVKPINHIYRIKRPDGQQRVIHARAEVVRDDNGRVLRMLGTAHDITDRKETEDRLHQMEAQMAHVARVSTLGEMMAGIAHEINQPLCSVQTFSEAVGNVLATKKQPDLGSLREWNDAIGKASARAVEIVKRLRGFARRSESHRSICGINEIVDEAAQLVAINARRHKAVVRLELSEVSPLVSVDRVEIQQVVVNLVQNALEAMTATPVAQRELSIRTALAREFVEVSVTDRGPGLPLDGNLRIFDAFVTTKSSGLGIGLAIVSRIVESHDGRFSAKSNREGGATFCFSLPAASKAMKAAE